MSAKIGNVEIGNGARCVGEVWASRGAIEIHDVGIGIHRLDPIEARNYAALLMRAADEVERIRAYSEEEKPR